MERSSSGTLRRVTKQATLNVEAAVWLCLPSRRMAGCWRAGPPASRALREALGCGHRSGRSGADGVFAGPVDGVAFSPDSKTLATGGFDGRVKLWDVASRSSVAELRGDDPAEVPQVVLALACSPDGRKVAVAGESGTVVLRGLASGKVTATLIGHKDAVAAVAFAPDGRTVATASLDHTVRLWDAATGADAGCSRGTRTGSSRRPLHPMGRRWQPGSYDRTIRLWDVDTGRERATLEGHNATIHALAYAPYGNNLGVGRGRSGCAALGRRARSAACSAEGTSRNDPCLGVCRRRPWRHRRVRSA